jgi:hypothetical protein
MARTVMAIENVISALCTGMDVRLGGHTYRMEDGRIWIVGRRYPNGLDGASEEVLLRCDLTLNQFLDLTEKLSEEDRAGILGGLVLRAEATDRAPSRAA